MADLDELSDPTIVGEPAIDRQLPDGVELHYDPDTEARLAAHHPDDPQTPEDYAALWADLVIAGPADHELGQPLTGGLTDLVTFGDIDLDAVVAQALTITDYRQDAGPALLAGLTDAQQRVVRHDSGPLAVTAGPGSGKTHVLVRRIGWLLLAGVPIEKLIVATFARAATLEIRGRLHQQLEPLVGHGRAREAAANLKVTTLHALAREIVIEHPETIGLRPGVAIISHQEHDHGEEDAYSPLRFIAAVLEHPAIAELNQELSDPLTPQSAYRQVAEVRRQGLGPDEALANAQTRTDTVVALVYRGYRQVQRRLNVLDLDEVIAAASAIIDADRSQVRLLHPEDPHPVHVLTDEAQDLSVEQLRLLIRLAGPELCLSMVGDTDQAIFGFQGADPDLFSRVFGEICQQAGKPLTTIEMTHNFRSANAIVQAGERLMRHQTGRAPRNPVAVANGSGHLHAYLFGSDEEEADFVCREIAHAVDSGTPPGEILVLSRIRTRTMQLIADGLQAHGVPYEAKRTQRLSQTAMARGLVALLGALTDPHDPRWLNALLIGLVLTNKHRHDRHSIAQDITDAAMTQRTTTTAAILALGHAENQTPGTRRNAQQIGELLTQTLALPSTAHAVPQVVKALIDTPQLGIRTRARSSEDHTRLNDILSVAWTYREVRPGGSLREFTSRLDDELAHRPDNDVVRLDSIHAVKGAEASLVIVAGATKDMLPLASSVREGNLDEERRVMFVGLTRAKDRVLITSSETTRTTKPGGATTTRRTGGASSFLREIGVPLHAGLDLSAPSTTPTTVETP
ncbi:AAA family ATPase [Conexibacter sp. W3-3-2]|uniref:ATP-dependent helicase n=1 Tax=Conexibacter sp. W3-3-2 TaxID=2675227 RepID=UPI0012B930DE|nr:ATP-dependent helicase [Conexibacter sp. W3-3-2]MTD47196.1 AAA family ATPase [Conexibacter sp. W3-3-2]